MPVPTVDNNHVAEAVALLTDMYRSQPVISGLASVFGNYQDLENAAWGLINGIILASAVGDVLDKYGSIIKLPRSGMSDADYKVAIQVRLRIIRSHGTSEDVLQTAALILASFVYQDWTPATWTVQALNVLNPVPLLQQLGKAGAAGTRGVFQFSTWSGNTLIWGSTVGTVAAATGFKDTVSNAYPNAFISDQDFK